MRKRFLMAVVVAAAFASLGATSASAATEFGDTCSGDEGVPVPYTLTTLSASNTGLPLTAPVSGVITQVKMQIALPLPLKLPEQVKVLHPAGGNNYTVTGQATIEAGTGVSTAPARMPVAAGDRLALHGLPFTYSGTSYAGYEIYCEGVTGDVLGAVEGDVPPGATKEFAEATQGRVPLAAVIEPDADNDGYGDETQDACPQSAATQAACPAVTLSTTKQVNKGSVTIVVTVNTPAPVSVKGVVKLGKGKKATLNGGTQNLTPGVLGKFRLKFSKKLKAKLGELSPKQSLQLKVTVTGTNVAGQVTTKTLKVKLRGQG